MIHVLIAIIALSNIAWLYAWSATANGSALNWVVGLIGPEGATADMFVPSTIVIALAFQTCLGAFLLWENSRRKSLAMKLRRTRDEKKDLAKSSKEIERKIEKQEKELKQSQGTEERARLLETQTKDLESFNVELKRQNIELQRQNEELADTVHRLELKLAKDGPKNVGDKLKGFFSK